MSGAAPSMWSAMAALTPAASPMPIACADKIAGYARSDVDSRVQTLSALDSIQRKTGSISRDESARVVLQPRHAVRPRFRRQRRAVAIRHHDFRQALRVHDIGFRNDVVLEE